jgi:hypothetical protein
VRTHEILRDTMYPESVSVERSDRERKGEWIEQNRGSNRKDTIGPKYGQVTLTGIKELNSLQAPLQNIRPNLLPATLGPLALSLSSSQALGLPATRGRRSQPPGGATASDLIMKPYTSKGVQDTSDDKLGKIRKQGQMGLTS